MNDEFSQFPSSNDEDKNPDKQFEDFMSQISDDDELPVVPDIHNLPDEADEQKDDEVNEIFDSSENLVSKNEHQDESDDLSDTNDFPGEEVEQNPTEELETFNRLEEYLNQVGDEDQSPEIPESGETLDEMKEQPVEQEQDSTERFEEYLRQVSDSNDLPIIPTSIESLDALYRQTIEGELNTSERYEEFLQQVSEGSEFAAIQAETESPVNLEDHTPEAESSDQAQEDHSEDLETIDEFLAEADHEVNGDQFEESSSEVSKEFEEQITSEETGIADQADKLSEDSSDLMDQQSTGVEPEPVDQMEEFPFISSDIPGTDDLIEESTPEEDPAYMDNWLFDQVDQNDFRSILILKANRTWKLYGGFSSNDVKEIERAVGEAQKAVKTIDMARYIRLGQNKEKFLLYAKTISGSMTLCTINYCKYPLSEIRNKTHRASRQLSIDEEKVVLPQIEVIEEIEEVLTPVVPKESGVISLGEAPQVRVDDLFNETEEPTNSNQLFTETDGWVFEEKVIQEEVSDTPLMNETNKNEEPLSVELEEKIMEEDHSDKDEKPGRPIVVIPKSGYGRVKINKPTFGKLFHLTENELSSLTGVSILKSTFSGMSKTEPAMTDPEYAVWVKQQYPNWQPEYIDILAYKRKRIRNQKPAYMPKKTRKKVSLGRNHVDELPTMEDFGDEGLITPPESLNGEKLLDEIEEETLEDVSLDTQDGARTSVPPEQHIDQELEEKIPEDILETSAEDMETFLQPLPDVEEVSNKEETTESDEKGTGETEATEEDFIFVADSSDFLKELANDSTLRDMDQSQDATDFFEEYFNRSGEPVDEAEAGEEIAEFIPVDESTDEVSETENFVPTETISTETSIEEDQDVFDKEDNLPENKEIPLDELEEVDANEDSDFIPPAETLKGNDIDEDYNSMFIAMQEKMNVFQTHVRTGKDLSSKEDEAESGVGDFPLFDEESGIESTTLPEEGSHSEDDSFFEEKEPGSQQTVKDLRKIISDALTDSESGESSRNDTFVDDTFPDKLTDGELSGEESPDTEFSDEYTFDGETFTTFSPIIKDEETKNIDSILDDDLFPWETEADASNNLEATPTPQAWLAEEASNNALIDLLTESDPDPVHLGFDQPIYTCILVPELNEFSLTEPIAQKLQEWLPRLSHVFGWQFENIVVKPAYLQWVVRVPAGTSQGSIVRKIRQQTSLRIFGKFPELKEIRPDGNFWAKGYLVVAGSNPPPAEFLDDFIQKNRKQTSTGNS